MLWNMKCVKNKNGNSKLGKCAWCWDAVTKPTIQGLRGIYQSYLCCIRASLKPFANGLLSIFNLVICKCKGSMTAKIRWKRMVNRLFSLLSDYFLFSVMGNLRIYNSGGGPVSFGSTHLLVLIGSDCGELSLFKYKGPANTLVRWSRFVLVLGHHNMDPGLISVHRVQYHLKGLK